MKRVLLTLLTIVVVLGLFAAAGYAGYRFGYMRGAQITVNRDNSQPGVRPFDPFDRRGMPGRDFGFERGFHRGFRFGGPPMRGFGFFSPLMFLVPIAGLALIVWFVYWLFTRSGWRLTRTTQTTTTTTTPPSVEAETRTEDTETDQ